MMKRMISVILATILLVSMMAGCTAIPEETLPAQPQDTEETTLTSADMPDLETLYYQGMDVLAEMGDDAPVLFPETDINYLDQFYPGLADIELKQLYAGVAPVTNAPFEVVLVEVADEADVPTVLEIFQARADNEGGDTTYPENAAAWLNDCKITSRGCYVFLAVLMGSCEVPAEFILD